MMRQKVINLYIQETSKDQEGGFIVKTAFWNFIYELETDYSR